MNIETYRHFAQLLIALGILPAFCFIVVYSATYSWWSSRMGVHLMAMTATIGAALTVSMINLFVEYPYQEYVALAMYAAIAVVLWHQLWILVEQIRKETPGGRKDPGSKG